jgi:hypothetical protein
MFVLFALVLTYRKILMEIRDGGYAVGTLADFRCIANTLLVIIHARIRQLDGANVSYTSFYTCQTA